MIKTSRNAVVECYRVLMVACLWGRMCRETVKLKHLFMWVVWLLCIILPLSSTLEPHGPSFCSLNTLSVLGFLAADFSSESALLLELLCLTPYCHLSLSLAFFDHTTYRILSFLPYHITLFYFYCDSPL